MICIKRLFQTLVILISFGTSETKKPYSKRQQAVWRLECDLGVINDPECPVDGGWAPWGAWSACHGPCDDVGQRKRVRECINPLPSRDGLPCSGPNEEIKSCYITNCTIDDFRKLVKGDAVRYDAFHQLEAIPALMERCLQMECPFEAIEVALAADNTWQINPEALWNALQCVKHNIGCPVIGEWGVWGAWSSCGARCGKGLRWRVRRCDTPPPSAAQLVCVGCPLQAEECEGDQCAVDDPFNEAIGTWSDWSQWTTCSEKCGTGVKRRKRTCDEKHLSRAFGTWGTHCRGQHDQLQVCENKICVLDGGWSGWGVWGPCSHSCGAGKRSRARSCTRPMPASGGINCMGPRTEVGSCNLTPCDVYSHSVAVFNGDSFIHYNFDYKRSTLFHCYVRFMPLSPHGILVRRGTTRNPQVRLSLQKWHVCLDANGESSSCGLPRLCSPENIEPAVWHTALVTITSEAASLRLDDEQIIIKGTFPCDPELPDNKMTITIGEKFHGEIQELMLNFIPLNMTMERDHDIRKSDFYPSSVSNIAYENANREEAYIILDNDEYLRIPCFNEQNEWRLELTLKPTRESGTLLYLQDNRYDTWFHVILQNSRLKMKLAIGDFRSESSSSAEFPFDHWLDVVISKKRDAKTIEATINAGENLHVLLMEEATRKRRESQKSGLFHRRKPTTVTNSMADQTPDVVKERTLSVPISVCGDEFYIGGIPQDMKQHIREESSAFAGVIASLSINNERQDLHSFSKERYKNGYVQISSRTASISGYYHEIAWGESNRLNLTCLHARTARSPHTAHWLFLDTTINGELKHKSVRSVDDGRVLRLVASGDNDLRGFYTCRAHSNRRTRNIVTYGVLGKIQYKLSGPDTTTAIALFTTLTLVVVSLGWLFIEGLNDLRNGYGFFRDAHLTPEEEAEAVCKYIDDNIDLYSSKSDAKLAKARAKRRGRQLASHTNFAAQEPQGLMQAEDCAMTEEEDHVTSLSEPDGLPTLPEVKNSSEAQNKVLTFEPCYSSSPDHNAISPRTRFTSSSSLEVSSPRLLGNLLKMHGLRKSIFRKNKLKYRAFLLLEMDKAIVREGGVSELNMESLRNACLIRGLNGSHLSNQDMRDWLQKWLFISQNVDKQSYSLLLHCPIFFAYNHPQNWVLIY